MLTAACPKLEQSKCTLFLRAFFRSPAYPFLIAALMAVSELFSLELLVYFVYLFLGTLCVLFCEDLWGVFPIACCGYMTFSAENNPGWNPETTVFGKPLAQILLIFVLAAAAVLLGGRLVQTAILRNGRGVPKLLLGFLALGLFYLLAGAFSGYYATDTVFYGALQILSLCGFYFLFYYTVDWENTDKRAVFWVFTAIGCGLMAEIAGMYLKSGILTSGVPSRTFLYTGWGIYNNVGGMMALCMPAPFYFSLRSEKYGFAGTILGCLFFLFVALTQSRSAILCGGVVFLVCAAVVLVKTRGKQRVVNAVLFGALLIGLAVAVLVLHDKVSSVFASLFEVGMNPNGRTVIYENCWKSFCGAPWFGKGFYHTPGAVMSKDGQMIFVDGSASAGGFIPARAHNTVLQLLASGGIFALAAYLFHRLQTALLLFRRPTAEKTAIALCIASLLLASLLDCHFFNLGPGILYGCLLVAAEGSDKAA